MQPVGIVGVGYEGRNANDLVADLVALGVSKLVDVRLTPISRKPGLSKTALGRALNEAGIAYEHRRELGNPKANRPGFGGLPRELAAAKSTYESLLGAPAADEALNNIAEAGLSELIAILCFEADQNRCHRDVVLQEARKRSARLSGASTRREC
ncbi:DUF488 domain-containing protein [Actinoplanes bogorensis]|uniref:DUF488 domain-containing protein n=1 Tax=Paractinoplanes bogorensis TaxID=1610840 RepID=A0ABS5YWH9_9ACTN|nr:DUF488 domain-containing protein [Actinoplanes bogorensis]